jgi:hypothetical protein
MQQSTYAWLGLDPRVIQETVWKESAVHKINAIKSNNDMGYKVGTGVRGATR